MSAYNLKSRAYNLKSRTCVLVFDANIQRRQLGTQLESRNWKQAESVFFSKVWNVSLNIQCDSTRFNFVQITDCQLNDLEEKQQKCMTTYTGSWLNEIRTWDLEKRNWHIIIKLYSNIPSLQRNGTELSFEVDRHSRSN